ncbi:hypothetical protein V6O07_06290, partial [Arthrospira platensis SPKY2]
ICLACGIETAEFDSVVTGAGLENGGYRIPQSTTLLGGICEDMQAMLAPFEDSAGLSTSLRDETLHARLSALLARLEMPSHEVIDDPLIALITSGKREAGDSLHLLVMDAHKALNRLQVELAAEDVDGAAVYGIDESD